MNRKELLKKYWKSRLLIQLIFVSWIALGVFLKLTSPPELPDIIKIWLVISFVIVVVTGYMLWSKFYEEGDLSVIRARFKYGYGGYVPGLIFSLFCFAFGIYLYISEGRRDGFVAFTLIGVLLLVLSLIMKKDVKKREMELEKKKGI